MPASRLRLLLLLLATGPNLLPVTQLAAAAAPPPGAAAVTATPLAPPSAPPAATAPRLFTPLDPAATGIVAPNPYDDPLMWSHHYREFSLGAIGTGLAAGDVDGDGLPDLFIVAKCGPSRLFRNLGNFRFEDITAAAGVAGPADPEHWQQGAALADIDNDGDLDLAVCRWGAPNLLYLNDGSGHFTEEAAARGLAVTSASSQLFFADIDHDGDLDVYLQTNLLNGEARPNGEPDRLFTNDGTGHFTDVSAAAGISGDTQGHSATWWDYDGDGDLDLYVANDFKDPDSLYQNDGTGHFTNVLSYVVPHTPHSSMGADFGDLDNNGRPDLLVADMAATTRAKSMRGMARIRANMEMPATHPGVAPQLMRNAVFLNPDGHRLLEVACLTGLAASDWTWTVRLEDFDNDGRTDVVIANGMVRELHSTDITNRMQQQESMAQRIRIMRATPVLAESNLAFRNDGDLAFTNVSAAWGLDRTGVTFGGVTADFDGDGDLDLAFTHYDAPATLLRNDSPGGHRVTVSLRGTTANRQGVGATITLQTASGLQSRALMPQRGYLSSSEPILHFGLGADDRIERLTVQWGPGRFQTLTDLPADQHYVITEPPAPESTSTAVAIPTAPPIDAAPRLGLQVAAPEDNSAPFPQATELPFRTDREGPGLAIGDLNGDQIDDVVVGGTTGHPGEIRTSLTARQWVPSNFTLFSGTTATADAQPFLVELNGDGHPDLLLPQAGTTRPDGDPAYQPRAFFNDGRGGFDPAPADFLPTLPLSIGAIVAADFDHDGHLDVFLGGRQRPGRYPEPAPSALLLHRGDRLTLAGSGWTVAPGLITAALATDVDLDGWPDLVLADEWSTIRYLHNDAGQGFTDRSAGAGFTAAGTGWWSSLATADFNSDGRPDYAVGNNGLNTPYTAPATLLRGPFGDEGQDRLIEAVTEDGRLYPRRSLSVLTELIPSLKRRFRAHDTYATTPLDDILPADQRAAARTWTATQFASGVFLSQPDGTYAFTALPRFAQLAPTFGLVAVDWNADGHTDLVGVQNRYAVRPETGRFDGGLGFILFGDSTGALRYQPATSLLHVQHDAKALALIDLQADGVPDLCVTRNDDTSMALLNPNAATPFLALRLLGPPANPTGLGTRITVVYADGHTVTTAVGAGGSHLAQSTATVFCGYDPASPPRELVFHWPQGTTNTLSWPAQPPPILNIRLP